MEPGDYQWSFFQSVEYQYFTASGSEPSAVRSSRQLSSQNFRRYESGATANARGSRTMTPSSTRKVPKSATNWLAVLSAMMPASRRPLDRACPTGALPPENSFRLASGSSLRATSAYVLAPSAPTVTSALLRSV